MFKNRAEPKNSGWMPFFSTSDLTTTGKVVSNKDCLNTDTVIACLNIRASTIAKMPIKVYKKTEKGKEVVNDEVSYLLNTRPNPYQTPTQFKKLISCNVDIYGDAFVWIETKKGMPFALWHLNPLQCDFANVNGNLWLTVNINNVPKRIKYENILHFTDINFNTMTDDTVKGKSKLDIARTTIGNVRSSYELLEKYYQDGTLSKGIISTSETLNKETKDAIKVGWRELNGGISNSDIAIVDGGLEYKPISNTFADMCIVELSKLNKENIATVFQVPLHMINALDRSTFNNIQQQSLDFVGNIIQPLLTDWEEEIVYKLFTKEKQEKGYYAKFDERVALRSDDKTRAEYYKMMLESGVYSINDVLHLEDKNGIGELGDKHRVSLNYIDLEKADEYQLNKARGGDKSNENKE